jgi:hypothetical protein
MLFLTGQNLKPHYNDIYNFFKKICFFCVHLVEICLSLFFPNAKPAKFISSLSVEIIYYICKYSPR